MIPILLRFSFALLRTKLDEGPLFPVKNGSFIEFGSFLLRSHSELTLFLLIWKCCVYLQTKRFVQTIEKSAFSDWQDVWHLEENLQKNVKMRIKFCAICCFLSKIHLYASFFLKKIWCVRKQFVILHRLKKVMAFYNGKRLYSNNG